MTSKHTTCPSIHTSRKYRDRGGSTYDLSHICCCGVCCACNQVKASFCRQTFGERADRPETRLVLHLQLRRLATSFDCQLARPARCFVRRCVVNRDESEGLGESCFPSSEVQCHCETSKLQNSCSWNSEESTHQAHTLVRARAVAASPHPWSSNLPPWLSNKKRLPHQPP